MKTNEVKACVTRQLRRLQILPERGASARRPACVVGRSAGRHAGAAAGQQWPVKGGMGRLYGVDPVCPAPAGGSRCFHEPAGQNARRCSAAAGRKNGCRAGLDREQRAPAVQCAGNGGFHAGSLAPPARDDPAAAQLAEDLYQYQFVDGAPNVRLRWGRDLYASPTEKTKENEKEN